MNRIGQLLSRRKIHADLSQEIEEHLREKTENLMAAGMSRDAARELARREFGNATLIEEHSREVWAWAKIEKILADLKFALRQLRKSPVFASVSILMLAIGIGVNTAAFSIFHHVLMQPLRFSQPEQLYSAWEHIPSEGDQRLLASGPDIVDFHDQSTAFVGIAAYLKFTETWIGHGEPTIVSCTGATQDFYSVLGLKPILGRLYTNAEYATLDSGAMLISERFWKEKLSSDPAIIGKTLNIGGPAGTVVGVVEDTPDLVPTTDIWLTLTTQPSWDFMKWRNNKFLHVVGRLKPGTTTSVAEQQLTAILRRADGEPKDVQVQLEPLKTTVVGPVTSQLRIVMAAAGMILLLICLNIAALLLVRAVQRAPEMAVRLGLGASRARIWQQLLIEGMILSATGCAAGLLVALMTVRAIPRIPALDLPRIDNLHLNTTAVAVTLMIICAVTVLFALLPARSLSDVNVSSGLRSGRTTASKNQRRSFSALVTAEITCAVVLSVAAGLLVHSFWKLHHVDAGFEPEKVLATYLRVDNETPHARALWQNMLDSTASLPGVSSTAAADCVPGILAAAATLKFDDRPNDPKNPPAAQGCWTSAGFFKTIGASLIKGRVFSAHDGPDAAAVVIINAEAAHRYWPGGNPIGKHIAVAYTGPGRRNVGMRMREIVGIVHDIKQRTLDQPTEPVVYLPYLQDETDHVLWSMNLYLRSDDPIHLSNSVRTKIHALYPNQPIVRMSTMADVVARSLASRTYSMSLIAAFAVLAVLLAGMGIYGVMSYVTAQRTHEFGIRMALGANRSDVLWNVIHSAALLAGIGIACGITLSFTVGATLKQLLFETTPFDPMSFGFSVIVLAVVALFAALHPAWRAARLDPRTALNAE
ncbi:MAG TPA: ABC transporter permease [Candidatus Angelobacter sp.]|jgi:putative ABC transport system permease protein